MAAFFDSLGAAVIVFVAVVMPIAIIMHYRTVGRRYKNEGTTMSAEDQEMLHRVIGLLERMDTRIGSLERILDADDPRWRERRAAGGSL